jgi:branched-chain amino acid transport system substrate-binding protein
MGQDKVSGKISKTSLTRRTVLSGAAAMGLSTMARAQAPAEVKVGLIVPLSGIYTRPGQVMKMGAEMGIEHINAQGGIKSLGGAKMKLVVIDCGDTTEKAKNAAQRMVAQETDLVAATGSYLSSFTLAVTEVTERAQLPVLTLSYSDLLTDRGFKFIFQTAAPASVQSQLGLPELMKLAETASGKRPKTVAMLMDNTATSVATAKALKEKLLAQEGLQLVVEEVWTPPLSDATPLIQKVRSGQAGPAAVHAERGLRRQARPGEDQRIRPRTGQDSDRVLQHHHCRAGHAAKRHAEVVQGIMTIVANWGCKGHEDIIAELKAKYKEPWATQNVISTYGDMWLMKAALEKAGKADRLAVADAFRTLDGGPAKYYPGGQLKFDEKGRRVGAGVVIVQWQNGVPVTVYPSDLAQSSPFWPKKS